MIIMEKSPNQFGNSISGNITGMDIAKKARELVMAPKVSENSVSLHTNGRKYSSNPMSTN